MLSAMRSMLQLVLIGVVAVGCNAIFGIEVKDPIPQDGVGGGGATGAGGAGGDTCDPNDGDGDGVSECDGDCDDSDENVGPGGTEVCGDDIDQDCSGVPDNGCIEGAYVSALVGNDDHPGTQAFPVKTIAKGLANAQALGGGRSVAVAEGTYGESITLHEGISVTGGYRCTAVECDWTRDIAVYKTIINAPTVTAVDADADVTRNTLLEGFIIGGADLAMTSGTTHAVVDLDGAAPTVSQNRIEGATVSCIDACDVATVRVHGSAPDGAGPLIERNTIVGSTSSGAAAGVHVEVPALITNNVIDGGSGRYVVGIRAYLSDTSTNTLQILNNDVVAGTCSGVSPTAQGIQAGTVFGAPPIVIDANTININADTPVSCTSCDSNTSCGGIWLEGGNHVVTNNIARGVEGVVHSHGLMISDGESNVVGDVVVNANTLLAFGAPAGLTSAAIRYQLFGGSAAPCGRVRNNILDGGRAIDRYGVLEDVNANLQFTVEVLQNNQFANIDAAWRRWDGVTGTDYVSVDEVNDANGNADLNVDAACALDNAYHLMAGSPCANIGTSSEAPDHDIDGDPRPLNGFVDLGADERE